MRTRPSCAAVRPLVGMDSSDKGEVSTGPFTTEMTRVGGKGRRDAGRVRGRENELNEHPVDQSAANPLLSLGGVMDDEHSHQGIDNSEGKKRGS